MKRIVVLFAAAVSVWMAPAVMASINSGDTITLTDGPGTNPGGSFFVHDQTAPIAPSFQTFCLERNESFGFNTPFYATIEDRAIFGGLGVADVGGAGSPGTLGVQDPLSPLTAWLFAKATFGGLAGYLAGDNDANTALQNTIWYIENELAALPAGLATNFYNDAVAAAPTDLGNVRVLNLWTSAADAYTQDGKRQSMLVLVPEASTFCVWSILGLVGFGAYKNRRKLS